MCVTGALQMVNMCALIYCRYVIILCTINVKAGRGGVDMK